MSSISTVTGAGEAPSVLSPGAWQGSRLCVATAHALSFPIPVPGQRLTAPLHVGCSIHFSWQIPPLLK